MVLDRDWEKIKNINDIGLENFKFKCVECGKYNTIYGTYIDYAGAESCNYYYCVCNCKYTIWNYSYSIELCHSNEQWFLGERKLFEW